MRKNLVLLLIVIFMSSACQAVEIEKDILRIATTTSLDNSGLLSELIPIFEDENDVDVELIAVGTGQALALGERGDVDMVLVHAPALEIRFVESGFGIERYVIMYNDFVILGPIDDPANIFDLTISSEAFIRIHDSKSTFVSRGDQSGTHYKENQIWAQANLDPANHGDWFNSVGQGMGASLQLANEKNAYILTDRGTYLSQKKNLPNLSVLFGDSSSDKNPDNLLKNIYSAIPVNPENHLNINLELSEVFIDWISSINIQQIINDFGLDEFDIPLFYPNSEEWNSKNSFQINNYQTQKVSSYQG